METANDASLLRRHFLVLIPFFLREKVSKLDAFLMGSKIVFHVPPCNFQICAGNFIASHHDNLVVFCIAEFRKAVKMRRICPNKEV